MEMRITRIETGAVAPIPYRTQLTSMKLPHSFSLLRTAVLASSLFSASWAALAQSPAPASILVYNAQHASLTQAWAEAFTRETGIKVTLRQGGDTELGNQLVQEGANSPADVFLTENSPAMALVDGAGLFAPLDAATAAQVAPGYRTAHGRWVGIAARTTVFVYQKAKFPPAQLPKSMLDLANPEWKGRWGASPAGADFQAIVSAVLATKGEAETATRLTALKTNAKVFPNNISVMKAVNAGEVPGGVIYHYYWYGDQAGTGENSAKTKLLLADHRDTVEAAVDKVLPQNGRNPRKRQPLRRGRAGPVPGTPIARRYARCAPPSPPARLLPGPQGPGTRPAAAPADSEPPPRTSAVARPRACRRGRRGRHGRRDGADAAHPCGPRPARL